MARKKDRKPRKFYSSGRVKRGAAPLVRITKDKYRRALPELRRDFEDRCAYCMRHICTETEMQVDHFDPRRKKDKLQVYSNLFLSDAHCNGAKSDSWPTDAEIKDGIRFINCCEEQDYGEQIFEDPKTHELVGTTPAAIYHIDTIDLNDPGLVNERRYRYELFAKLDYLAEGELTPDMKQVVDSLRDELKRCIPRIPPPENYWSVE